MYRFFSRTIRNSLLNYNLNKFNQQREFKSKNVLYHRKGNNIPFYAAIERFMFIVTPIIMFYIWYDPDYPGSFVHRFFSFDDIEDTADETNQIVKKKKKIKYAPISLDDEHRN